MTAIDRSGDETGGTAERLRMLEQSLLDPAVRRDGVKLRSMLAEDFMEFGSSGRTWTRSSILELLSRETAFIPPDIEDFRCDFLSEDVALVTYRTLSMSAESVAVRASLRSSIWIYESGAWRVRFHQGTPTRAEEPLR